MISRIYYRSSQNYRGFTKLILIHSASSFVTDSNEVSFVRALVSFSLQLWIGCSFRWFFESRRKLVIYSNEMGEFISISALLKSELLNEADAAFHQNDRPRCVDAVNRLYGIFDDEDEAY